MYQVKGGWVALTPKPSAALPPQTLEPLVQPTWKYVDAEHLAENGIYTADDLTRLREHIMFPLEQPILINNFAKAAAGHRIPASGISLTHLLDEDALDLITKSASERLFGGFLQFGTITAGLIGIWVVIKAVKLIADTIIHGYALHSVYGWSIHLLGAVFSSITSLLLHVGKRPREHLSTAVSTSEPLNTTNHTVIEIVEPTSQDPPAPVPRLTTSAENSNNTLYPLIKPELAALSLSLTNLEKRVSAYAPRGEHSKTVE